MVTLGLEKFLKEPPGFLAGKKIGLLCNQASTDHCFRHSKDLIKETTARLICLFSPQHGFYSEKQDNMVESDHAVDAATGLPVYSLYGAERRPDPAILAELDVLLVDLVDVGTRVYTFLYTLAYCLEEAAKVNTKVIVLDRPNPVGGQKVEGNILREDCRSFVGLFPLPMRHGLTFGELALFINQRFDLGADLSVITMEGWQRSMCFQDTGLPWVFPSPNLPTPGSALVYPGQVIWEGTNISEGRGTTLPFELFGAPFLDPAEILLSIKNVPLPGCVLRPLVFEPTSRKWAGQACHGFQIHVSDPVEFLPYRTSLALFQAIFRLYPNEFQYDNSPYEYEFERLPFDLIIGDSRIRENLEDGVDILELEKSWQAELNEFNHLRQEYFLYV